MTTKIKSGVIGDNVVGITQLNVSDGINGEVLTTNGSGTLSFTDMTGGVDGIVSSADATAITIDSSENVGIGTTNPGNRLHIEGPASAHTALQIETITSEFDPTIHFVSVHNSAGMYLDGTTDNKINFYNGNGKGTAGKEITFDNNGNVGIGTTSPAAGLQVSKGLTNAGGPAAGASTAAACFGNSGSDDNYGLVLGADGFGKGYISAQRTDGTATTYDLLIQPNGGNVGIGTSTTNSFKTYIDAASGKGLFVEAGDGGYTALGFDGDALSTKGSITSNNGRILIG